VYRATYTMAAQIDTSGVGHSIPIIRTGDIVKCKSNGTDPIHCSVLSIMVDHLQKIDLTGYYTGCKTISKNDQTDLVMYREDMAAEVCQFIEGGPEIRIQQAWRDTMVGCTADVNVIVHSIHDGSVITVPCNKGMLQLQSGYFALFFSQQQQQNGSADPSLDNNTVHVECDFHDADNVRQFFRYLHCGEISFRCHSVVDFWRLHHVFQVPSLNEGLLYWIREILPIDTLNSDTRDPVTLWNLYVGLQSVLPQPDWKMAQKSMSFHWKKLLRLPPAYLNSLEFWNHFVYLVQIKPDDTHPDDTFDLVQGQILMPSVMLSDNQKKDLLRHVCTLNRMSGQYILTVVQPLNMYQDDELMKAVTGAAKADRLLSTLYTHRRRESRPVVINTVSLRKKS
jgi:hypothetical protein